jgi:hypothetical protein
MAIGFVVIWRWGYTLTDGPIAAARSMLRVWTSGRWTGRSRARRARRAHPVAAWRRAIEERTSGTQRCRVAVAAHAARC